MTRSPISWTDTASTDDPMRSVELSKGRVFVLALETGECVKEEVEGFARDNKILNAKVTILGGMLEGSSFVVGPQLDGGKVGAPISPIDHTIYAPSEFAGVGTIFPNEAGDPILHLHGSVGREGQSSTGCFRGKAKAWLTLEVIIEEMVGNGPIRMYDPDLRVSPLCMKD